MMDVIDLLFNDTNTKRVTDSITEDLSFENIEKTIFMDAPELYNAFISVVKNPLCDADKILERQYILQDFTAYRGLAEEMHEICQRIQNYKILYLKKSIYKTIDSKKKLIEGLELTNTALELPKLLYNVMQYKEFRSQSLNKLRDYISRESSFNPLKEALNQACSIQNTNFLSLRVKFTNGLTLKEAKINHTEHNQIIKNRVKSLFDRTTSEDRIYYSTNMVVFIVEAMNESALLNLCSMVAHINTGLQRLFNKIASDLLFYIAALKIIKYFKDNNWTYCYPQFCNKKEIEAAALYDLSFAAYMKQHDYKNEIIKNHVHCSDGNIFIIAGPNQGGKTTYLRSIGIAQLFAQCGLIVPASQYTCGAFPAIMTHFPKLEDDNLYYGKLAEELTRLRNDIDMVKTGGLILFNESFATTTTDEGAEIACDVITALSMTNACIFFVTHFYEFALNIDQLNDRLFSGNKAINLIAEVKENMTGGKTERTYRLVRGTPQKNVFAYDLL